MLVESLLILNPAIDLAVLLVDPIPEGPGGGNYPFMLFFFLTLGSISLLSLTISY